MYQSFPHLIIYHIKSQFVYPFFNITSIQVMDSFKEIFHISDLHF